MADQSPQQQYPSLDPYANTNGNSNMNSGSTGAQAQGQMQNAKNTVMNSKVGAP